MSRSCTRVRSLAALLALGGLLFGASLASAAASRIVRPETDAPPRPATASAPNSAQGSRTLPLGENLMRETAPGIYEGIVPMLMPDGSWQVHLDERFHAFSVMRRGAGGGLAGACVLGVAGLARWQGSGTAGCTHDHAAPAAAAAPSKKPAATRPTAAIRPTVSAPTATTVTTWEAR